MDERLTEGCDSYELVNPLTPAWGEPRFRPEGPIIWQPNNVGVRQQVSLAPQAPRVTEQGRMKPAVTVREQIAQALKVKEQAEQTLRVSMIFEKRYEQVSPTKHNNRVNLVPRNTCSK